MARTSCGGPGAGLAEKIIESLRATTKTRGEVEILEPDTLPNDGKVIEGIRVID